MTTRIVALFTLKPGITPETYEGWARSTDIPVVRALASTAGFDVFRATGLLGSDARPPYDYIETIDIADMAAFGADVASAPMQAIAASFQEMVDVVFITTEPLA